MMFTTEQPTQKQQLDIVLNLNRLTKEDKIKWVAGGHEDAEKPPRILYSADWKEYRVQILEGNPPEHAQLVVQGTGKTDDVWIRVRDRREDEDQIVIPPMSAISDLVDTIERRTGLDTGETTDPEALDTFNQLLEEELGGDWTREKLETLEDYLSAYTTIMKDQPFRCGYIDAFAGTGGYIQGDSHSGDQMLFPVVEEEERKFLKGSVRTALEVEPPFDAYVFIERNEETYEELVKIRDEYPEKDIRCFNEDANDLLMELCHERNWDQHRAVVFLDPFGMQVKWDTIEAIADTEAIDLWILFPLGIGANRLLTRDGNIPEEWKRTLNDVFGTEEWEDRFYETRRTFFGEAKEKVIDLEGIGQFYVDRLKDVFAAVAPNPRPLYNSRGNPLYLLCFAAANPTGAPTAVKIAQHILEP